MLSDSVPVFRASVVSAIAEYFSTSIAMVDWFIVQDEISIPIQISLTVCDLLYILKFPIGTKKWKLVPSIFFLLCSCSTFYFRAKKIIIILKSCNLLRVARVGHYFHFDLWSPRNSLAKRILFVSGIAFQIINFLGCAWFFVACSFDKSACASKSNNWVAFDHVVDVSSPFSIWIRSIYFILQTLTTVGYGDIRVTSSLEISFTVLLMLFAAVCNSFIISLVVNLVKSLGIPSILYHEQIFAFKRFLEIHQTKSSDDFQASSIFNNIITFKNTLYSRYLGYSEYILVGSLPNDLQEMYKRYTLQPFIQSHILLRIFQGLDSTDIIPFCTNVFLPKDYTFHFQEDRVQQIEIVREGSLVQKNNEGVHSFRLISGDSIGEVELITRTSYSSTLVTSEPTEIIIIPRFFVQQLYHSCSRGILNGKRIVFHPEIIHLRKNKEGLQSMAHLHHNRKNRKITALLNDSEATGHASILSLKNLQWLGFYLIIMDLILVVVLVGFATHPVILFALRMLSPRISKCRLKENLDYFSLLCNIAYCVCYLQRSLYFPVIDGLNGEKTEASRQIFSTEKLLDWNSVFTYSKLLTFLKVVLLFPYNLLDWSLCLSGSGFEWIDLLSIFLFPPLIAETGIFYEKFKINEIVLVEPANFKESLKVFEKVIYASILIIWLTALWQIWQMNGDGWVSSIYWCLTTITTTGYGDFVPTNQVETVFSVVAFLSGSLLYASAIAQFVNAVQG